MTDTEKAQAKRERAAEKEMQRLAQSYTDRRTELIKKNLETNEEIKKLFQEFMTYIQKDVNKGAPITEEDVILLLAHQPMLAKFTQAIFEKKE